MKTAICLSGHIRNFVQNYNNFNKFIIGPLSPDIFIHTWDTYGWRAEGNDISVGFGQFKGFDHYSGKIDVAKITELYQPKKMVIENYSDLEAAFVEQGKLHKPNCSHPLDRPENTIGMAYKLKKCNELKTQYEKENKFVYDIVIRSRPDIVYSRCPLDEKIIFNSQKGLLLTSEEQSYGIASDIFAVGNSAIIDKYSDLYSNLDKINNSGCKMNPHEVMKFYFNSTFSAKWVRTKFGIALNRCRNLCENRIECSKCDSTKKILSNIF